MGINNIEWYILGGAIFGTVFFLGNKFALNKLLLPEDKKKGIIFLVTTAGISLFVGFISGNAALEHVSLTYACAIGGLAAGVGNDIVEGLQNIIRSTILSLAQNFANKISTPPKEEEKKQ